MDNYEKIKTAITNKQSMTCYYNRYLRKISPHAIGRKNATDHVLVYQYGGYSKSGLKWDRSKNWRCIEVDKITHLTINDDSFQSANNHSRPQNCIDFIDVQVVF